MRIFRVMMTDRRSILLIVAAGLLAACGSGSDPVDAIEGAVPGARGETPRYNREYIFVAPGADAPLVVPFSFQATDAGDHLDRSVRGWLARGEAWDRFLEEQQQTTEAGGVWRVVPDGDLAILAGGPTELEALRFERGERRLTLSLGNSLSAWNQGGDTRFRILRGRLSVGAETVSGVVLEHLRVDRILADGWPAPQELDALFLTSGDSLQLVMAETTAGEERESFTWVRTGETDRTWDEGDVSWLEVSPYQEARRDIPRRWSFRVPGASIEGEGTAIGSDATLGPERGARRAVEVRYSVQGWVMVEGVRREVQGTVSHAQQ